MDMLFFILAFMSFLLLIIGIIKPSLALKPIPLKNKNRKSVLAIYGLSLLVFLTLFTIAIPDVENENADANLSTSNPNSVDKNSNIVEDLPEDNEEKEEPLLKGIKDKVLSDNISKASSLIEMDISKLNKIRLTGQWVSGDIYYTNYKDTSVEYYIDTNKNVNSINVGDVKVYEDGYEPLDINDYLIDLYFNDIAKVKSKEIIKSGLKYPNTAKFPSDSWGFGRNKDTYMISGNVNAKNAFGVEGAIPFYIEYEKYDDSFKVGYAVLEGKVIYGKESIIAKDKKIKINNDTNLSKTTDKSFEITYGIEGDFGKKESIDGHNIIYYYLNPGEYTVTTDTNYGIVIVLKKEPYKNSSGYLENEVVSMNHFNKDTNNQTITIGKNEKVEVSINSKFKFTPKN